MSQNLHLENYDGTTQSKNSLNSRPQEKAQLQNCKKMDAWA
jgi:hypothetical protein